MQGRVVQLVQGETKALELESLDRAVELFREFPLIHIIDLDAAKGTGSNREVVAALLRRVRARVGGGVRTPDRAREALEQGASQVIVGSAAFGEAGIQTDFLESLNRVVDPARVILAVDVKQGRIAIQGWRQNIDLSPQEAIPLLDAYCGGFLCTCVDREGLLAGTDLDLFLDLRRRTRGTLIAAGGITTMEEVVTLTRAGIEVALGMAVYTGNLDLGELAGVMLGD